MITDILIGAVEILDCPFGNMFSNSVHSGELFSQEEDTRQRNSLLRKLRSDYWYPNWTSSNR